MILYGFWRSSATWRVRIALGHKRLDWEYRPVNLVREGGGEQHRPEYQALNPMGQVPLLELAEDDGSVTRIGQSVAIAEYLEERFPQPALFPGHRVLRARTRQLVETVNAGIQPMQNTIVREHVQQTFGADPDAWSRRWIERGLGALEAMVQGSAGRFAVGDEPTFADMCLVPQLYHARRYGLDTKAYPRLSAIEAACAPLDAFARARPERQPDAPPR